MRRRTDAELATDLATFEAALKGEFEGKLTLLDFLPILDDICKQRAVKFLENRLGHLNNADFILLTRMAAESVNLFTRVKPPTPTKEVIQPPEPVVEKPTFQEQITEVMKPRGRPKKT